MTVVKKVIILKERVCDKCKGTLNIGDIAVKDTRNKKNIKDKEHFGKTIYYHTECPTQ